MKIEDVVVGEVYLEGYQKYRFLVTKVSTSKRRNKTQTRVYARRVYKDGTLGPVGEVAKFRIECSGPWAGWVPEDSFETWVAKVRREAGVE